MASEHTAKRENPRWFPSEDIQWEMGMSAMVPPGPQTRSGPGRTLLPLPL